MTKMQESCGWQRDPEQHFASHERGGGYQIAEMQPAVDRITVFVGLA